MKYIYLLLFYFSFNLLAFEIIGDPKNWKKEDFIGFDEVGDSQSKGDISSAYVRILNDKLFLRITFDDMYFRKNEMDSFKDSNIAFCSSSKGSGSPGDFGWKKGVRS